MITSRCVTETLRQIDYASAWLPRLDGDGFLDPRIVVHRSNGDRHPEGRGSSFDRTVVQRGERRGIGVEDDGDPGGRDLLEQLEPFSHQLRVVGAESRDVAAGSREAFNKAQPGRICHENENDRYRARLLSQRCERRLGAS